MTTPILPLHPRRLAARAAALLALYGAGASLALAQVAVPPPADEELVAPAPAAGVAAEAVGTLALDATSQTDDHSINKPTAWWVYQNVTAAQVSGFLSANNARLTQVEVNGIVNGAPRFTVRMVANSGSYAAPGGWWWYHGLTAAGVTAALNANSARLIDLEPYDAGGGVIRFAAVMVANGGTAARAWSWLHGVSAAQIGAHLTTSGHRIIDLDHYFEGGVKKYTAVMVANTGADSKAWQYWFDQTPSQIANKVSSFSGRIVKLDRQIDGTYNFVQVKNTGTNNSAWWYRYGFTSMTALIDYANQLATRPVDIVTYLNPLGQRRFDAVFIDNANADTRRMRSVYAATFLDANGNPTRGIFAAYLKQVGGAVKVDLNGARRAETASALKSLHLLHSMREVQLGNTTLNSPFIFYNYPSDTSGNTPPNRCPNPNDEVPANQMTNYSFETGLDEMMRISDNRTTRGVVLRYGFAGLNQTAAWAGLTSTTVRHNIGCAYRDPVSGTVSPTLYRNDTSAADLARIYEGVWNKTLLTDTNSARDEFLESANPVNGVGTSRLREIIFEEAAALGKSTSVASSFASRVRRWSKGGSYNTRLAAGGQQVIVRSETGLIRLPVYTAAGSLSYRTFAFGHLISDTPVTCWEDFDTDAIECPIDTVYTSAFNNARPELFRTEIRSALQTW